MMESILGETVSSTSMNSLLGIASREQVLDFLWEIMSNRLERDMG